MAFGEGAGAASPAQGNVAQRALGWADSNNRVVTVLVLGVPLIAAVVISSRSGFNFVRNGLGGSGGPVPAWADRAFSGTGLVGDGAFLLLLVILAAVSEEAGALAVTILAAIWAAWLLGHGSGLLKAGTGTPPPPSGGVAAGTNKTKGA